MEPALPAAKPAVIRRPFFKHDPFTTAFFLVIIFFASQFLALLLVSLYPNLRNWTGEQADSWLESIQFQFCFVVLAESIAVLAVLKVLKHYHIPLKRIGLIRPRLLDIAYALTAYAAYFVIYLVIIMVAGTLIKSLNMDQKQELGFDNPIGQVQLLMTFVSLVILPPIAEEIMFRGFLYSGLRNKMRIRYAVILTSIIFGFAHLQFSNGAPLLWVAAIDTFTLSCFLCYLREKTGSIWPGVILHAVKNFVAYVALYHMKF